jgi:hypothetical protein
MAVPVTSVKFLGHCPIAYVVSISYVTILEPFEYIPRYIIIIIWWLSVITFWYNWKRWIPGQFCEEKACKLLYTRTVGLVHNSSYSHPLPTVFNISITMAWCILVISTLYLALSTKLFFLSTLPLSYLLESAQEYCMMWTGSQEDRSGRVVVMRKGRSENDTETYEWEKSKKGIKIKRWTKEKRRERSWERENLRKIKVESKLERDKR